MADHSHIYRGPGFTLSQAAVDQLKVIESDQRRYQPADPPVLAGISLGRVLDDDRLGPRRLMVGFWSQSQVSEADREALEIGRIEGFDMALNVVDEDLHMFEHAIVDFQPEAGFFLRDPD